MKIWLKGFICVIALVLGIFCLIQVLHGHAEKSKKEIGKPYSQETVQEAIRMHKPVIIDFFAEWCPGCHELDRTVFSNKVIQAELLHVEVLRVDATDINSPRISALVDQYNVVGLPTVIFLDDKGEEVKDLRVEGAVSLKEFENSLHIWEKQRGVK